MWRSHVVQFTKVVQSFLFYEGHPSRIVSGYRRGLVSVYSVRPYKDSSAKPVRGNARSCGWRVRHGPRRYRARHKEHLRHVTCPAGHDGAKCVCYDYHHAHRYGVAMVPYPGRGTVGDPRPADRQRYRTGGRRASDRRVLSLGQLEGRQKHAPSNGRRAGASCHSSTWSYPTDSSHRARNFVLLANAGLHNGRHLANGAGNVGRIRRRVPAKVRRLVHDRRFRTRVHDRRRVHRRTYARHGHTRRRRHAVTDAIRRS